MNQSKLDGYARATQGSTRTRWVQYGTFAAAGVVSSAAALGLFLHFSTRALDALSALSTAPTAASKEPAREEREAAHAVAPSVHTDAVRSAEPSVRGRPLPPDSPPTMASAKVERDPAFDRAQRERLLAFGEERLKALQSEAKTLPETERAVLAFRAERMQKQLAELRAKP